MHKRAFAYGSAVQFFLAFLLCFATSGETQQEQIAEPVNAVIRFVNGLRHDSDHLGQLEDVVRQARAAR
jgi:hypothetical protein